MPSGLLKSSASRSPLQAAGSPPTAAAGRLADALLYHGLVVAIAFASAPLGSAVGSRRPQRDGALARAAFEPTCSRLDGAITGSRDRDLAQSGRVAAFAGTERVGTATTIRCRCYPRCLECRRGRTGQGISTASSMRSASASPDRRLRWQPAVPLRRTRITSRTRRRLTLVDWSEGATQNRLAHRSTPVLGTLEWPVQGRPLLFDERSSGATRQ